MSICHEPRELPSRTLPVFETDKYKITQRYKHMMELWDHEVAKDPQSKWTRFRPQLVECVLNNVDILEY